MVTWTCNVCKEERPDEKINVLSRESLEFHKGYSDVRIIENIRYCNDRMACWDGAQFFSFFRNGPV